MALPANFDINYYRGNTYPFYINAKDNEGNEIDLDGWTPTFTISTARGPDGVADAIEASASVADSIITCTISPSVGAQLTAGPYVYDVQVSNGAENVYTYLTGNIYVTLNVTEA